MDNFTPPHPDPILNRDTDALIRQYGYFDWQLKCGRQMTAVKRRKYQQMKDMIQKELTNRLNKRDDKP